MSAAGSSRQRGYSVVTHDPSHTGTRIQHTMQSHERGAATPTESAVHAAASMECGREVKA